MSNYYTVQTALQKGFGRVGRTREAVPIEASKWNLVALPHEIQYVPTILENISIRCPQGTDTAVELIGITQRALSGKTGTMISLFWLLSVARPSLSYRLLVQHDFRLPQ
jgi:hypothetical protein